MIRSLRNAAAVAACLCGLGAAEPPLDRGLEVLAYACEVSTAGVTLSRALPFSLDPG